MIAFLNQLPSDVKIRKELRRIIFGSHLFCPRCHSRLIHRSEERYRCRICRLPFSLLSHTWLSSMKISLRTWYSLLWCWTQKIPVLQAQKLCHMSEPCVRDWYRKFRLNLPNFEPILSSVVQLDEVYFKSLSLLVAKQVGTNKIAYQIIKKNSVDKCDATKFLFQYIKPGTQLNTDGSPIYEAIDEWWPVKHRTDIHKNFQFGLTSEIEGLFGNLRTFIRRMYHHVTPNYLPELVAEFSLRFSHPELFESPLEYARMTVKLVPFD